MKQNKWSKRRELISRIDQKINEHGFVRREETETLFESVYSDLCNKHMDMLDGNKYAYKAWLSESTAKFRRSVKETLTLDEDGKEVKVRRWGYDPSIDGYVFQYKLSNEKQVQPAYNANNYKAKQAKSYSDTVKNEKMGIEKQEQKIKHDMEVKQYWDSQPKLFTYPETAEQEAQQNVR